MLQRTTEMIKEGKATILLPKYEKVSKRMLVFYNPEKALDRDLSIAFLQSFQRKVKRELSICDLLAASGIRSIRYACEVDGIASVILNDINPHACKYAKQNVELNKERIKCPIRIFKSDANKLLFTLRKKFDFIDIDPFGSPNRFLNSAILSLHRHGILALTSTDTACLCGTYPETCFRKYGAFSFKTEYYAEVGMRILLKKAIEVAAQYDRALKPIFCYFYGSYFRAFLECDLGARRANKILNEIGFIFHCPVCLFRKTIHYQETIERCPECNSKLVQIGPLFLGKIWNEEICKEVFLRSKGKAKVIAGTILEECKLPIVTYYTTSSLAKLLEKPEPKLELILAKIREGGYKTSRTHFFQKGFRTDMELRNIKECF